MAEIVTIVGRNVGLDDYEYKFLAHSKFRDQSIFKERKVRILDRLTVKFIIHHSNTYDH